MATLQVIELFAGVGGFRLGLENTDKFRVIWSNQWEPSTKIQHASMVYEARFGSDNHVNKDISNVAASEVPDADMLVGGFPCQDYSVATTLNNAKGLAGRKGVLWWQIHRILSEKNRKPTYLLLENVDRLLKSPSSQRGRDFAIMLKCLGELGYAVTWRIVNAAEYGMPQRRRRVFILAYLKNSPVHKELENSSALKWITSSGVFADAFPVKSIVENKSAFELTGNLKEISENFNKGKKSSPFENTGTYVNNVIFTARTKADYDGRAVVLGDIIEKNEVPANFTIKEAELPKWDYLKGNKC